MPKTVEEKFRTVIDKNTYYYFNSTFEESYEGYLNSVRETLHVLKNEVDTNGLSKGLLVGLLADNTNGLTALLAITGFSNESMKRLITLIRVVEDPDLSRLTLKDRWAEEEDQADIKEWSDSKIEKMVRTNEHFRMGIVNLFFQGATVPFLARTLPLFELKKLSILKLQFEIPAMIDTIVRYKEKGSYSGKTENNTEAIVNQMLDRLNIPHEKGDLRELVRNNQSTKRTMDFIIPSKANPVIIAESSFLVTTSSGQGDKSKTEISIAQLIKRHYPRAKFYGFVDGIGWYVRKEDLKRMVVAYDDVFTYHRDELARFERILRAEFENV